jgi:AcrR family transcriptional regulator
MSDQQRTPRERMVYSAAQLVREQGVSGTGVRDVIARSGAPRGSFQHYFPGGKDQLVGEAIAFAGDFAARWVRSYRASARRATPSGLFAHVVRYWKDEFARRGYLRGCPLMASAADLGGSDSPVIADLSAATDQWHAALTAELAALGVPQRRARRLAVVALSALEGAIMLARVRRSPEPLNAVVSELGPLLDAAAEPAAAAPRSRTPARPHRG